MPVRRAPHLTFRFRTLPFLDVEQLFEGQLRPRTYDQLCACSVVTGQEVPISGGERALLERVRVDRSTSTSELDAEPAVVDRLLREGLLLADDEDETLGRLRDRGDRIDADAWDPFAAQYHFLTRWSGVDLEPDLEGPQESTRAYVEHFGPPPPAFVEREAKASVELPLGAANNPVVDLLLRRRTVRDLDPSRSVTLDQLGTILRYTFGCHGYFTPAPGVVVLQKTSPSGGALHPIEAYPLVIDVDGVESGLYHYNVRAHRLDLLGPLERETARALAPRFAAGQAFAANASVVVALVARFARSFWKYRGHPRAYAVLLMDAAHLSQTFYVLCTELGLGPFVTAAINSADIDAHFGLDDASEGTLALLGCGVPVESARFDPAFRGYVPRETELAELEAKRRT